MTDFTPVSARARGRQARLPARAVLESAISAQDPHALVGVVNALGDGAAVPPRPAVEQLAAELEAGLGRVVGEAMRLLSRWDGAGPVLEVFSAHQDRASLRALLRGAVQGIPAGRRLAGLVPSVTLPAGLLRELSARATPGEIAATLLATGHPAAGFLVGLTARAAQPELFAVERALGQSFAARCAVIRAAADPELDAFIAHHVDLSNLCLAVISGAAMESDPGALFLDGGQLVDRPAFLSIVAARDGAHAAELIHRLTARTPLASVVAGHGAAAHAEHLERAGTTALLAEQRRFARTRPLSSAPATAYLLSLSALARDIRHVAWAAAMGAPAAVVTPELVTPWR